LKRIIFLIFFIFALIVGLQVYEKASKAWKFFSSHVVIPESKQEKAFEHEMFHISENLIIPVYSGTPAFEYAKKQSPTLSKPLFTSEEVKLLHTVTVENQDVILREKGISEERFTVFNDLKNRSTRFYGRVLDQDDQPVSDVYIKLSASYQSGATYFGGRSWNRYAYARTDSDGYFTFFGIKNHSSKVSIRAISKRNYILEIGEYRAGSNREIKQTSFEEPHIVRAWKVNIEELNKNKSHEYIKGLKLRSDDIKTDSRKYIASFSSENNLNKKLVRYAIGTRVLKPKFHEATDGDQDSDVVFRMKREFSEASRDGHTYTELSAYRFHLSFDNYLIKESNDRFPYLAPTGAYLSEINFKIDSTSQEWRKYRRKYKKSYYIKSKSEDFFGYVTISVHPKDREKESAWVSIYGDVNIGGSRYLLKKDRFNDIIDGAGDGCSLCWTQNLLPVLPPEFNNQKAFNNRMRLERELREDKNLIDTIDLRPPFGTYTNNYPHSQNFKKEFTGKLEQQFGCLYFVSGEKKYIPYFPKEQTKWSPLKNEINVWGEDILFGSYIKAMGEFYSDFKTDYTNLQPNQKPKIYTSHSGFCLGGEKMRILIGKGGWS